MRRVSPASRVTVATISPSKRGKYVARTDYGTRSAELQKQSLPFGKYRATLYRRSDVDRSSWFLRVFLREEGRHYRKSLRTSDRAEAVQRATTELVSVLSKVESGQRILAISLKDLVRRFSAHLEQQVASGALSPRTLTSQRYRVNLGCEFLKVKLAAGMDAKVSGIDGEVFGQYLDWRMAKAAEDRPNGKIRRDVVRDELLVIRKMFLFARKEKLCSEKAIPNWDIVVEREGPRRARITQQNYKHFISTVRAWASQAKNEKETYNRQLLQHFVLVVANSGMRSGELFGLRNEDVERRVSAKECLIHIRAETSKVRRGRQITLLPSTGGRTDGSWEVNYLLRWFTDHQRHKEPKDYVFAPFDVGKKSARDVFYHAYKMLRISLKEKSLDWPGDRSTGARPRPDTVAARGAPRTGGRGYLPRPRADVAAARARSLEPRAAEGHVGHRALSQRRLGRSFAAMLVVRRTADRVQLVPQPTLPEVPERRRPALARSTPGGSLARAVLPRRVHLAGAD
jgi:integrase